MIPDRTMRQTKRLKDILAILVRNGFGDLVDAIHSKRRLARTDGLMAEEQVRLRHSTRAERLRKVIEELGPTYVKLGQVLSTRPDLVPQELLAELTKLQDHVEPFPFDEIRKVVDFELGQPLELVFESFERKPLASASLGQVHRARLDGQDVVVKVQRPAIRETMDADIQVMMQLAGLVERRVPGWAVHQPTRIVKEFAQALAEELDYRIEAAHQERVAGKFEADPTVRVPRVFHRASTSRILTMEFVDGIKVSDLGALRSSHADFEEVARRGFRFIIEQTLIDGFFHADPHPGNIFVLPDNVVCFIDFGLMGRLGQQVRDDFVELVYHVIDRNPHRVAESVLSLASADTEIAVPELERDVARFMDSYCGRPLREMDLLGEILRALDQHGLRIAPDLFLMLKAIFEIEAIAVALAPELDVLKEAEPYVRRVFLNRFRPQRLAEETAAVGREFALLFRDAPASLRELSRVIRRGSIRIGLDQESMPAVLSASDRIANRLAFACVLGASLVGSAIMAAAKIPPTWNGISVLGLGGFFVSVVMSVWLLMSILRHGRL